MKRPAVRRNLRPRCPTQYAKHAAFQAPAQPDLPAAGLDRLMFPHDVPRQRENEAADAVGSTPERPRPRSTAK